MSLGTVCYIEFDPKNAKDWHTYSRTCFISHKAYPIAHIQGIYHISIKTCINWGFNCTETREKIRYFL